MCVSARNHTPLLGVRAPSVSCPLTGAILPVFAHLPPHPCNPEAQCLAATLTTHWTVTCCVQSCPHPPPTPHPILLFQTRSTPSRRPNPPTPGSPLKPHLPQLHASRTQLFFSESTMEWSCSRKEQRANQIQRVLGEKNTQYHVTLKAVSVLRHLPLCYSLNPCVK